MSVSVFHACVCVCERQISWGVCVCASLFIRNFGYIFLSLPPTQEHTTLHVATMYGSHESIVSKLIECKADVNAFDAMVSVAWYVCVCVCVVLAAAVKYLQPPSHQH